MNQAIRRARRGESLGLRACDWNAVADAAGWVAAERAAIGSGIGGVARDANVVHFRNGTGAALEAGWVVAIETPVFTEAENPDEFRLLPALVGTVPSATTRTRVGIVLTAVAVGEYGRATVSGIAAAKLDVVDRNAWSAAPVVGAANRLALVARGSIEVLYRTAGDTGVVWSIVRIGASVLEAIWVVLSATPISGSSPPRWKYELKRGVRDAATGAVTADANGEEVWAYNDFEDPAAWGHGQSLTPGGGATLTPAPVAGPVDATWTGLYDAGDNRPIYRFDVACPVTNNCGEEGG